MFSSLPGTEPFGVPVHWQTVSWRLGVVPLIERLGDQPRIWIQKGNELVHPWMARINAKHRLLMRARDELLGEIQQRQEGLLDRGQRALSSFEQTLLERINELAIWANNLTGERARSLRKTQTFLGERLAELRGSPSVDIGSAESESPATFDEAPLQAPSGLPFEGYDDLTVRQLRSRLSDLDGSELGRVRAYEAANKGRVTLLRAIDGLLE